MKISKIVLLRALIGLFRGKKAAKARQNEKNAKGAAQKNGRQHGGEMRAEQSPGQARRQKDQGKAPQGRRAEEVHRKRGARRRKKEQKIVALRLCSQSVVSISGK